jgi:hypothetical protein
MAETWDESKPAGSRSPALGDDDIREFKRAVRERLAEDHNFASTENPAFGAGGGYKIGKHDFVTLVQRDTSKTTTSDEVSFACKSVSGNPEVLLTPPSAGTDRQITKNSSANLNLVSGDFDNFLLKAGFYDTGSIDGDDIAGYGVKAANLDTGAVTTGKITDYAVGASQLNTGGVTGPKWQQESAGANNYFREGELAGTMVQTGASSYTTVKSVRFISGGTFRFYWGYRAYKATDYCTAYFRVKKNDAVIVGPFSDIGWSAEAYHYRTDDISISSGDYIEFQGYSPDFNGNAQFKIYLRGTNRTGLFLED